MLAPGLQSPDDSRALIAFDYDRDGDEDLLVTNINQPVQLLENVSSPRGHWLDVRLVQGRGLNRNAIGASIYATIGGVTKRRDIICGDSYLAGTPPEVHFGLGDSTVIDELRVRWTDGQETSIQDVPVDQLITLTNVPGACCVGAVCSEVSEADCIEAGGEYLGDGTTCSPDPCVVPTGACCTAAGCVVLTQMECDTAQGSYQGNGTSCSPDPCVTRTGACCRPGDSCTLETEADCKAFGREYQGDGTTCIPNACLPGACCLTDGSCLDVREADCGTASGVFQGGGTTCISNVCLAGACCLADGSCVDVTEADCGAGSGVFQGGGTSCSVFVCPQPDPPPPTPVGACCVSATCTVKTQADCAASGGAYRGDGSGCSPEACLPDLVCPPPGLNFDFVQTKDSDTGSGNDPCVSITAGELLAQITAGGLIELAGPGGGKVLEITNGQAAYGIGIHEITFRANDLAGNPSADTCTLEVIVVRGLPCPGAAGPPGPAGTATPPPPVDDIEDSTCDPGFLFPFLSLMGMGIIGIGVRSRRRR